jgi:hypothetical protein
MRTRKINTDVDGKSRPFGFQALEFSGEFWQCPSPESGVRVDSQIARVQLSQSIEGPTWRFRQLVSLKIRDLQS